MEPAVRSETHRYVRRLTLCRPQRYNTITPQLRDDFGSSIDAAERDPDVRVILLDAEGPAFCAGYARARLRRTLRRLRRLPQSVVVGSTTDSRNVPDMSA